MNDHDVDIYKSGHDDGKQMHDDIMMMLYLNQHNTVIGNVMKITKKIVHEQDVY